ncbi:DUF6221 family protein [Streptomyces sp. MN13]
MDDLVQFLRDRLDEDERTAKALLDDARPGRIARWEFCEDGAIRDEGGRAALRVKFTWRPEAEHIVRHDPARVLAEAEAKRALLEALERADTQASYPDFEGGVYSGLHEALEYLALPYADHPAYKPEWRP